MGPSKDVIIETAPAPSIISPGKSDFRRSFGFAKINENVRSASAPKSSQRANQVGLLSTAVVLTNPRSSYFWRDNGPWERDMILEFVTFETPAGRNREQVLEDAKHMVPKWVANRELLRKHFVLGLGASEGTTAGVYIWPSVEAAKKAHNEEWRETVKTRTGGYPMMQYFDLFLLIDNEQGRVTEWTADGKALGARHHLIERIINDQCLLRVTTGRTQAELERSAFAS